MYRATSELGLAVTRKEYSITRALTRMFGVWQVKGSEALSKTEEVEVAIGIRNSTDKHFAVGLCAGERVFVCDNLVFSGDFVLFRRHSGTLSEIEMVLMAKEAIGVVLGRFNILQAWHEDLKNFSLNDRQAGLLTVAALHRSIISPVDYPKFHALYFNEDSKYLPTLYGWHGAVTEMFKDMSMFTIHRKNADLNDFLRYEAPVFLSSDQVYFDFDHVRKQAEQKAVIDTEKRRDESSTAGRHLRRQLQAHIRKLGLTTQSVIVDKTASGGVKLPCGLGYRRLLSEEPLVTTISPKEFVEGHVAQPPRREFKGRVAKPPKGEKTFSPRTARKKRKTAWDDPSDVYFTKPKPVRR
jgi:hypothetical protein